MIDRSQQISVPQKDHRKYVLPPFQNKCLNFMQGVFVSRDFLVQGLEKVPLRDFLTKQEGLLGTKTCFLGLNEEDSQGESFLGLFQQCPSMHPLDRHPMVLFDCYFSIYQGQHGHLITSRKGLGTFQSLETNRERLFRDQRLFSWDQKKSQDQRTKHHLKSPQSLSRGY